MPLDEAMSLYTVGEIAVWLSLAGGLGIVLGWLLHVLWSRARARRATRRSSAAEAVPDEVVPDEVVPDEQTAETLAERSTPEKRIKGNRSSMIYHSPDSPAYERTRADRWFDTEEQAEAAGYRRPKNLQP